MKLFTIDENGKFIQFKEKDFKAENKEIDLENLLEKNPEYLFDNKILIIGRQVATNLNTYIDLLGIDNIGNTVIIELKRDKTPRETLAQLLEYASYVDNLDYEQLNKIYQEYTGDEVELEEYHSEYFGNNEIDQNISWNKSIKFVIIAQKITPEIKQTALFLRKKGFDIYCIEFKYFLNETKAKIISSNFVVSEENYIKGQTKTAYSTSRTDKNTFLKNLDKNGKNVFSKIFKFSEEEHFLIRWGTKGFSFNISFNNDFIGLFFGYPTNCPYKQSIITGFKSIERKVKDSGEILNYYKREIKKLGVFNINVGYFGNQELKWVIDEGDNKIKVEKFIKIIKNVADKIIDKKEINVI